MSNANDLMRRWDEIGDALRTYRDQQREIWGDVDDIVLAGYISGTCSDDEKKAVEAAIRDKPAIRELVEVVQQVMQPVWVVVEKANSLKVTHGAAGVWILKNPLRILRNRAGRLLSQGLELFMAQLDVPQSPAFAGVALGKELDAASLETKKPKESESETHKCCWQIPVEEAGYTISIAASAATTADRWNLAFEISSDANPQIAEEARFSLMRPDEDIPVTETTVSNYSGKEREIGGGMWNLIITVGDDIRVVPLELGPGDL